MEVVALKKFFAMVLRYTISGFAGIGANLAVFSFLVLQLEVWYIFSAFAGFLAAYLVTFSLHKFWTFKNLSADLFYKQSVVYFFSAVATLLVNTFFLFVLVAYVSVEPVLAQFISLLFAAVLSFLFTTQVTFHTNAGRIHSLTGYFHFGVVSAIRREWRWLLALLAFTGVCILLRLSLLPLAFTSDAVSYVATAEHLFGNAEAAVHGERILKPLAPFFVGALAALGISPVFALLVQACVMYGSLGLAVYWFGYELFRKSVYAFATAVIVLTTYPMLRYGVDYLTETGIWTFYFAALAAMLQWYRKPSFRLVVLVSLFFLLGLLWKEYIVLAGLMFFLLVVTHPRLSLVSKTFVLLQTAFLVLLPWGMWQYAVFLMYDYTYLDWLAIGAAPDAYQNEYTVFKIGKTLFALFFGVWAFVLYGLFRLRDFSSDVRRLLLIMIVPSLGFLLWGYVSSRLFFSLVPLLVPLAVVGFMALPSRRIKVVSVLLIAVLNCILIVLAFDPYIRTLLN